MGNDEIMRYYIWLQKILGAGNSCAQDILSVFKSAENIYKSEFNELENSGLFSANELKKIKTTSLSYSDNIIRRCKELGIKILCFNDKVYPKCLRNFPDFPLVLYFRGDMPDFEETPSICIVGPRKVSDYGKKAAYSLGLRLSKAGFIIVSGGAEGSDFYSHTGALKGGSKTVLFMGSGLNVNYPPRNSELRKSVENQGCIISEYPPDTPAFGRNFPIRNRLMSAVSLGTVVIEGDKKSGSLITAKWALEQGKDVFVIPGSPGNINYSGSNEFLRDGAKPLLDASDIFNEYISLFPDKINIERAFEKTSEGKNKKSKKILDDTLSKEAKILYNYLDKPEFYPEYFKDKGLSDDDILSALIELEISGIIKSAPGGKYVLK